MHTTASYIQENYLKGLYLLGEAGTRPVRTNKLSAYVNTSAASVCSMLQTLEKKDFVRYEKYKGAQLSPTGLPKALEIIRRHRLWEVFLHARLSIPGNKVHAIAEQLEHVQGAGLVEGLDTYLGNPKHDPHGARIPSLMDTLSTDSKQPLATLSAGEIGKLVALRQRTHVFLSYLKKCKLHIGDVLQVVAQEPYDNSMQIIVGQTKKHTVCLSEKAARHLYVQKIYT